MEFFAATRLGYAPIPVSQRMTTLPKDDAPRAPRTPGQPAEGAPDRGAAPVAPPAMRTPAQGIAAAVGARTPEPARAPTTGSVSLSPGTIVDGRYRVIRFLNQGGNGVVHEVEHLRTGRRLAMKSLVDDASAARLEQEARATSLMKNAHVVKITDMGPAPGARSVAPYLVMELLEGQSLRDLLDDAGQLPLELTVNIALQVCECLAEAHNRSVIHRDLKPENLFLLRSPWPNQYDVVVLDFGVMKIAGEGPIPKGSLTRTGSTVGTPYYMSLEQLRNSSAVDARADIYSLGVVLYECLAGRKPFVADTIGDLVYALCSGPPTPLARLRPDLPPDVCDAVMRSLKMNREDRQPSMTELGATLLPHGHPAFSLWLRAADSAPPANLTPMAALHEPMRPVAPVIAQVPTAIVPIAPIAPAPPTPDEGEGTTVTAVAPHREIEVEDSVTSDGQPTGKLHARQRHDRETPTEMYQASGSGSAFGDRDTPTRALPAPSLPDLESALARSGAAAPAGPQTLISADQAPTFRLEPPRFGAATERMLGQDSRAVQPIASGGASAASPPRFDAPVDPLLAAQKVEPRTTGTYSAVVPAAKPGWQVSLDKALTTVGGFVEDLARKVKAQPPPIRYAILATGALCVILLFVLFVVLVFR